jgi:hypothetical protein
LPRTPRRSGDFFDKRDIFVYIVTVTLGARLIAQDRRANALQIYLSKPLTRAGILGKFAILAGFLLFITWVPAVAAGRAGCLCGQLRVRGRERLSVARHHATRRSKSR